MISDGLLTLNGVLGACAVLVVAERLLTRVFRLHFNADSLTEQVAKLVASGNVRRAVNLCGADLHNPLARVLEAGLKQAKADPARRGSAMKAAIATQAPRLRARIRWLLTLALAALGVGLAGTIFENGAWGDGLQGPLRHVALGLGIGLFCVVSHALLSRQANAMLAALERHSVWLDRVMTESRSPVPHQSDV